MKPLFIFSLPRSGSTLLQRILSISQSISTASEPWILLPCIYALKTDGVYSEYWHKQSVRAIRDFYEGFPNGRYDYSDELHKFIINLYKKRSNPDSVYFLDKTPRYHLISDEIINLFPEGKFIILWRNPLAVASSIINSWYQGKWKLSKYNIDLYEGLSRLTETCSEHKSKILTIQYEQLIQDPSAEITRICKYLNIDFDYHMISSFNKIYFTGQMGDRTGTKKYQSLNSSSLDSWKTVYGNFFRKHWAKKYLKWIGDERLAMMGYDYSSLINELNTRKKGSSFEIFQDLLYYIIVKLEVLSSPWMVHRNKKIKKLYK